MRGKPNKSDREGREQLQQRYKQNLAWHHWPSALNAKEKLLWHDTTLSIQVRGAKKQQHASTSPPS